MLFISLEDETGMVQVIVWPSLREEYRDVLMTSTCLGVLGRWQRRGDSCNLIAGELFNLSHLLGELPTSSRDFK